MEYLNESNVPLIMKRTIIFLLCVAAVIGLLLFLLRKTEQTPEPASATEIHATNSLATNNTTQQNPAAAHQAPASIATPKMPEYDLTTEAEKNAKARQMLEAQNKPIELWAEVVDQDNTPLSGVKVEAEIGHFVWPPEQYPNGVSSNLELFTDANGQFHIEDNSATGVGVILQKDGYEQESPKGNGYTLGSGGGTKDNPVVLKMWSTNVLQKLVTGEKHFHMTPDGRPYFINLSSGVISETGDGDLKVWIKYPAQVTRGQLYDWSCEIEVPNGGLLEETDSNSSMFSAPTDGYIQTFRLQQQIKGGQSGSIGEKRFYINLNNGQEYGRMTIDLIAPYNDEIPGLIRLSYAINPSGSRILR